MFYCADLPQETTSSRQDISYKTPQVCRTPATFKSVSLLSRPSPWSSIPHHILLPPQSPASIRRFSSTPFIQARARAQRLRYTKQSPSQTHQPAPLAPQKPPPRPNPPNPPQPPTHPILTHLTPSGSAHMVNITSKLPTSRTATAIARLHFSNPLPAKLITENGMKKGDVLGVARIAGIMATKKCPDIIPLCHPILISGVEVGVELVAPGWGYWEGEDGGEEKGRRRDGKEEGGDFGYIDVRATVSCTGATGVEMEALTAATAAVLTAYDMCKAVDKGMVVGGVRVVEKRGGKSGDWAFEG